MLLQSERVCAAGSDQKGRIESAVRDALKHSNYRGMRRVSCAFDGDTLKLRGTVSSYYEKQVAQSLVLRRLNGTVLFENQLEVVASVSSK